VRLVADALASGQLSDIPGRWVLGAGVGGWVGRGVKIMWMREGHFVPVYTACAKPKPPNDPTTQPTHNQPTIQPPKTSQIRWELYEGHLRASSVRAALAGFDSEVRRLSALKAQEAAVAVAVGEEGTGAAAAVVMPLTKGEMASVLVEVGGLGWVGWWWL
jgi:hypothetical protein